MSGCNAQDAGAGCVFDDDEATGAGYVNVSSALTISDDFFFYTLGDDFYDETKQYGQTPIQNVADQYGLCLLYTSRCV